MKVIKNLLPVPSTGCFDLKRTLKDIPCLFSTVDAQNFSKLKLPIRLHLIT